MTGTESAQGSEDRIRWKEVVAEFVARPSCSSELRDYLARFSEGDPREITERLSQALADEQKRGVTAFLVSAIQHAVGDHALSDTEMRELRHVSRLLRIEEGEVLAHHPEEVSQFLGQELERLFEDARIDAQEAIHKVKLQELLGLSYDEFLSLTVPQTEAVLLRLLRHLEAEAVATGVHLPLSRFKSAAMALDTVFCLNLEEHIEGDRSGYLYVLVNPAMPGLIKIGRTSRPPATRVSELSGATGVPVPFVLLYDVRVPDAVAGERYVHQLLEERGARVAGNREFFDVTPSVAVELLLQTRDALERNAVPSTTR